MRAFQMSDYLSLLVLSFVEPMREQYANLHLYIHIQEQNNNTQNWRLGEEEMMPHRFDTNPEYNTKQVVQ